MKKTQETIGKIMLEYKFYKGNDLYSDGDDIEERLLNICKSGRVEEELINGNEWPILYHLSDIRKNIVAWYPIEKKQTVLEIGSGCGAITGILAEKAQKVTCIELSKRRSLINAYRNKDCDNVEIIVGNFEDIEITEKYDYVTLIGVFEYAACYISGKNPYEEMLIRVQKYLKPNGKILIAIENKMGMKYINGAKEDHVSKPFVGIEDYRYIKGVRTFSKPELCELFKRCGINKFEFFYPMPDYKLPHTIYSEDIQPHRGDIRIWGTNYDTTRIGLYNDGIFADQVCKDNMFDYFANSFLIICNAIENPVRYVHYTGTRIPELCMCTKIEKSHNQKIVTKEFLNDIPRGYDIVKKMTDNYWILHNEFSNIQYLKPIVHNEKLEYAYIEGMSLEEKMAENIHNTDSMIQNLKYIVQKVLKPNEKYFVEFKMTKEYERIFGNDKVETQEKCLQVTNLDMILSNLILQNDKIICIDYEWIFDFPIPYEYIIYRCIENFFYKYGMYFSRNVDLRAILKKVDVKEENIRVYAQMQKNFYEFVYGEGQKYQYLKRYVKPCGMVNVII